MESKLEAAEARCARLQQALTKADKTASKAHDAMWAMDFDKTAASSFERDDWKRRREQASQAIWDIHNLLRPLLEREALAGQTSVPGSSAADVDGAEKRVSAARGHHESVGERQGRRPGTEELTGLLVELSRWSRVAELNGDLHARIASALAGPDTPADSQEDEWFIPEGDRQCGVVHKMARATCMKRRGHDGSHATPQGTWIDGPWCEYPADSQEDKT